MKKESVEVDENRELNPQQKMFVEEYLSNNFNAIQAYIKAYPNSTYESAMANAYHLKSKPYVAKEINRRLEEKIGTKEEIANKILDKLIEMAFAEKTDEIYTPSVVQKSIDLLQKQLGLQTNKIEAKIEQVIFKGEDELED